MHSSCFNTAFIYDLFFLQDAQQSEEEDDETVVDSEQVINLFIRFLSFEPFFLAYKTQLYKLKSWKLLSHSQCLLDTNARWLKLSILVDAVL